MNRIIALIDGFNFYYSLDEEPKYHKYKWLDYRKMLELFCDPDDNMEEIYYFSALTRTPGKRKRHEIFIKALEYTGIKIVLGRMRTRQIKCKATCKEEFKKQEEKQTDVAIAVKLIDLAINDKFDKAFVVSGDTDLVPAYKYVRQAFPKKKIGILFPINRDWDTDEIKKNVHSYLCVKEGYLKQSQFPDEIIIDPSAGIIIRRPSVWI